MTDSASDKTLLRVADLPQRKPYRFALRPSAETCAQIAAELDLTALRKLSFVGTLSAMGKSDWQLQADLGATVVQPCVVTLDPVTTRIDTPVIRQFLQNWQAPDESEETEMPEDDTSEQLPDQIDLIAVLSEALALAVPDYPRLADAELAQTTFAADGITPMQDEDTKPFAGLAALKDKLEKPDN